MTPGSVRDLDVMKLCVGLDTVIIKYIGLLRQWFVLDTGFGK